MTKLYLIRHAEAEGNIYRRMQGQYNSRITQNGLRQIEALRRRFECVTVDAVYSSDLFRTRKTAEAIYLAKHLPLHTDPRFREVNVGAWENVPFGELERCWPEALECFSRDPERWSVPGAECYDAYSARFEAGLREVAEAHPGETVAVFSHGCVLSGGLHRMIGLPHNAARADNASVSLLEYEDGCFRAVELFDRSHLSEAISTLARQRWWRQNGGRFNLWFRDPMPEDDALYDPACAPQTTDRIWIAMLDDEAVGYVSISGRTLSSLWLKPSHRHWRKGDQLLGQAVVELRARGAQTLTFGVPTANLEAVGFFSHHARPVQMDDCYTVFEMEITVK